MMLREANMTIQLSEELRQALQAAGSGPATMTDPETDIEYVLIRAEVYSKLRAIADAVSKRAGWDEPEMDDYERYRK
jgi:hypothetical protein